MKLLLLLSLLLRPAIQDSLLVVSWNVENFLDYRTDSTGRHTSGRFYSKCNAIAKTLLLIAERNGRLPDAVALMEVGDRFVLERLIGSTPLRKLDYAIVHYDSPDRRGIDCALLYRRSRLRLRNSFAAHLYDADGAVMPTRDILAAEFDSLAILVNHHPSKVGADSERRRGIAMRRMTELMDSLWRRSDFYADTCAANRQHTHYNGAGPHTFFGPAPSGYPVLAVGDYNDDVWHDGSPGTIKYNGSWEKIDGHFARGLTVRETVFADPSLSEPDRTWGGVKPRRAFSGPRWLGGVSDHYPIVLIITPLR
ncbi:MAG: hypothetical protein IK031_02940 [Bacteroidales bacterium]|nr:hypothetical protein [Bacteroidales bacterium]